MPSQSQKTVVESFQNRVAIPGIGLVDTGTGIVYDPVTGTQIGNVGQISGQGQPPPPGAPPAPPQAPPEQKKEPSSSATPGEVETHPLKSGDRGFTPPPDSKPVEWVADNTSKEPNAVDKNKPTVYEDKAGTRYYTPNSTMWQMGYKTDKEYYRAETIVTKRSPGGKPLEVKTKYGGGRVGKDIAELAPYVEVITPEGSMHITRAEAAGIQKIDNPEDASAQLHDLLGIPEEAPALPMDRRLVKAVIKGSLNLDEYVEKGIDDPEVYQRAGFNITQKDITESKARIKSNADIMKEAELSGESQKDYAEYLTQLRKSDPYIYEILTTKGEGPAKEALAKRENDIKAIEDRALSQLDDYRLANINIPKYPGNEELYYQFSYKIDKFIHDHPVQSSINILQNAGFSDEVINNAQQYIDIYQKAEEKFLSSRRDTQLFVTGQALGFKDRTTPFSKLSEDKQRQVIGKYLQMDILPADLKGQSLELLKAEWVEAAPLYGLAFIGALGTVGGILGVVGRTAETATFAGLGAFGAYEIIKNWGDMNTAQKAISVTLDALMFIPVVGRVGKKTWQLAFEPSEATKQRVTFDSVFKESRDKFIKDVAKGNKNEKEMVKSYDKFVDDTQKYGNAELELEQARYVIDEIKIAKTPGELRLLNLAKERINELEKTIKELEANAKESGKNYADILKGSIKVDDPAVFDELSTLPQRTIKDMKDIAQGTVKPRNINAIKRDIDKAIRETAGLEKADKIDTKALIIQTDYLNQLNRELYLARLAELNHIYLKAVRGDKAAAGILKILNERQVKIETAESARAGIREKTAGLKQEFFKGVERTTEPLAGKESYAGVIEKLEFLKKTIDTKVKDPALKNRINNAIAKVESLISTGEAEIMTAEKLPSAKGMRQLPKAEPMRKLTPAEVDKLNKLENGKPRTIEEKEWAKYISDVYKSSEVKAKAEPIHESMQARRETQAIQDRLNRLIEGIPSYLRNRIFRDIDVPRRWPETVKDMWDYLENKYGKDNLENYLTTGEWLREKPSPLTPGEEAQLKGTETVKKMIEARSELDDVLDEAQKILKESDKEDIKKTLEELDRYIKEKEEEPPPAPETPPEKGVPTMITKIMEARLKRFGYTQKQIDAMKPRDAWDILRKEERKTGFGERKIKPEEKEGPLERKGTKVAVKEKTEVKAKEKTKTAEELERELYQKEKATERPSRQAKEALEKIAKAKKKPARRGLDLLPCQPGRKLLEYLLKCWRGYKPYHCQKLRLELRRLRNQRLFRHR